MSTIGAPAYGISKYLVEIILPTLNKNNNKIQNSASFVHKAKDWEIQSSGATEHCSKCHGQLNKLHPKTLSREERYKRRKLGSHWRLRDKNATVVNRV